jgi:hypothetical protein
MESARLSKISVYTRLHGVAYRKTVVFIVTALKSSICHLWANWPQRHAMQFCCYIATVVIMRTELTYFTIMNLIRTDGGWIIAIHFIGIAIECNVATLLIWGTCSMGSRHSVILSHDRDQRQILDWWSDLLGSLILCVTIPFTVHTHTGVQSRLHCRSLAVASNGRRSLSSEFPNCPRAQLPASNSNSSPQQFSSSLTHQLPTATAMYVCVRGGTKIQPLHRDLQWSIVLPLLINPLLIPHLELSVGLCIWGRHSRHLVPWS